LATNKDIIVVDDHEDIAILIKDVLQNDGFNVYDFNDPLLALDHFKENTRKFALIITDVRMPGMSSGIELVAKIKQIKPNMKVFLITSFEIEIVESEIKRHGIKVTEIFQKPILLKKLITYVNLHIDKNNL
jgi:two-component system, cell cycle response regulator CpdR